jgi:hypothetical protein
MLKAILIFALVVLFIAGGLFALKGAAKMSLPKELPKPLEDEKDDWKK